MARKRLDPAIFNLPVDKMRAGYYSDTYFNRARDILTRDGYDPVVRMQVFQRNDAVVGGIDEAVAILKLCSGRECDDGSWEPGWNRLRVRALYDGDHIEPYETALTVEGDYALFAHLETPYLGVLSRRTRIATNARDIVSAAQGKTVLFFPARFDHHLVQTGDGYAAYVSGALGVSTDANAEWWGARGMGTVPHALIAAYGGDTVLATKKFAEYTDPSVSVISLVDFDNDSVRTSLEVARELGRRLWGVRLDTSGTLVDQGTEVDQNGTSITTDASAIFAGLGGTIALTNPGYGTFSQSYAAQAGATGFGSLGGGSAVILGNNGHTYLNGPLFDTYSNVAQGQQLIANELGAFAAPEPSSLLMMGVGLLCLTCMGYRRNVLVVALRNWAPKVATTANRSRTLAR